jgi:hypothetical protein
MPITKVEKKEKSVKHSRINEINRRCSPRKLYNSSPGGKSTISIGSKSALSVLTDKLSSKSGISNNNESDDGDEDSSDKSKDANEIINDFNEKHEELLETTRLSTDNPDDGSLALKAVQLKNEIERSLFLLNPRKGSKINSNVWKLGYAKIVELSDTGKHVKKNGGK